MTRDNGRPGRPPRSRQRAAHDQAGHGHDHGDGDWDDDLDAGVDDDSDGGELGDDLDEGLDVDRDDDLDEDLDDDLAEDWDDGDWDEDWVGLKEAFDLPDALPPLRLPPDAELAATARAVPLLGEVAELARWFGERDSATDLDDAEAAELAARVGVSEDRLDVLWAYAGAVDWLEESESGHVVAGETARLWEQGDDEATLEAWSSTFAAVLTEAMCAGTAGQPGRPEVDFHAAGGAVAVLMYLNRRDGMTAQEVSELVADALTEDEPARVQRAWATFTKASGDPAAVLLEQLAELGAITAPAGSDGAIRLTPLGLREMRLQLLDGDVEVPLLPDDPLQVSAEDLLSFADGALEEEFGAEAAAWIAARGPQEAASQLLALAAVSDAADRVLAVAIVNKDIGAPAEPAWREHQDALPVRPYARVALIQLAGLADAQAVPPELALDIVDAAWLATDVLSVACEGEATDGAELAEALESAMPPDATPAAFLDLLARVPHPDAIDVLEHVGAYHPDKAIAKEARKVAYKASQREAAAAGSARRRRGPAAPAGRET